MKALCSASTILIGIRVWQIRVLFKVSGTRRGSRVDNSDPCTTRATPLRPPLVQPNYYWT
eukprot:1179778-Rhodomonas_salina.6